jgi:hypothetical protein
MNWLSARRQVSYQGKRSLTRGKTSREIAPDRVRTGYFADIPADKNERIV